MKTRPSTPRSIAGSLVFSGLAALSPNASADQGGVAFWWSGQFASLAAVPAAPGWSLATVPYFYSGSANKSTTFQKGDTLVGGVNSTVPMLMVQPGYAAEGKILGGQPYVGLAGGLAYNRTSVDLALSPPGLGGTRTDSVTKIVDFVAKFLRTGLKNYIGRFNITQGFLDSLGHVIAGLLGFLSDSGVLIGATLNNLIQDTNEPPITNVTGAST